MSILDKLNPTLELELKLHNEPTGVILCIKANDKETLSDADKLKLSIKYAKMQELEASGGKPDEQLASELLELYSKINVGVEQYVISAKNDNELLNNDDLEEIKRMVSKNIYGYGDQVKDFLMQNEILEKDTQKDV